VARAFAADPKVLLLDEPCAGVAPRLVETLREVIRDVAARGTAVLVVEHNVDFVRTVADRVAFLAEGKVLREGSAEDVLADDELSRVYFGVQRAKPSGDEPPRERNGPESMIERSR
jgi:ABC-type branched-subunit amino acid transport system ATPase component